MSYELMILANIYLAASFACSEMRSRLICVALGLWWLVLHLFTL